MHDLADQYERQDYNAGNGGVAGRVISAPAATQVIPVECIGIGELAVLVNLASGIALRCKARIRLP